MEKSLEQQNLCHEWFAWKPVLAERKKEDGTVEYLIVWLKRVRRSIIRVGGLAAFKYEL